LRRTVAKPVTVLPLLLLVSIAVVVREVAVLLKLKRGRHDQGYLVVAMPLAGCTTGAAGRGGVVRRGRVASELVPLAPARRKHQRRNPDCEAEPRPAERASRRRHGRGVALHHAADLRVLLGPRLRLFDEENVAQRAGRGLEQWNAGVEERDAGKDERGGRDSERPRDDAISGRDRGR
jgi:hypothetical protein